VNKVRAFLLVILATLVAANADAQPSAANGMAGAGSVTITPRPGTARYPTTLFNMGGLPVGIWARVPPPYDPTANRSAAANPLP